MTLSDVEIQVTALTDDGRPQKVSFTFDDPLEDVTLRWVRYQNGRYIPFAVPAVGQSTVIDAVPFDLFSPPDSKRPTSTDGAH